MQKIEKYWIAMKSYPVLWRHSYHDVIIMVTSSLYVQMTSSKLSVIISDNTNPILIHLSTKYTYSDR